MKNPVSFMARLGFISETRMLELYPPFFFMGLKVVEVSKDYRLCRIRVPLRWYLKNHHGTFFGGAICSIADPIPALLCGRIFRGTQMWSQKVSVEFLKPLRGAVNLKVEIPEESIVRIRERLRETRTASETFTFSFWNDEGDEIARVENTVFLKMRPKRPATVAGEREISKK